MTTLHDFSATALTGGEVDLATFTGKAVLVVNTASKCGFTPQLEGLQKLHETYTDQGFAVLGFPCDQFLHQEPGSEVEIGAFCQKNYGVTFPMFAKVEVNGRRAHPLYAWLKRAKPGILGSRIKWNFTKFLVGPDGTVVTRYGTRTRPEDIARDIEVLLRRMPTEASG